MEWWKIGPGGTDRLRDDGKNNSSKAMFDFFFIIVFDAHPVQAIRTFWKSCFCVKS